MTDAADFKPDAAVQKYLPMMHELAIRIDLVAQASNGQLGLTPPYAREFAYLQFRRICELIALGSLHLHGDLAFVQQQSIKKEWNAEKIMKLLHKNHPHAFPQSVNREKTEKGWHIQCNAKMEALTYDEFKQLYSECGEVLHRGKIHTYEMSTFFSQKDYRKVIDWQKKIVDLMNEHLIGRANGAGFYVISLRTESGYPECSTFKINGENGLIVSTQKLSVGDEIIHSYVSNQTINQGSKLTLDP